MKCLLKQERTSSIFRPQSIELLQPGPRGGGGDRGPGRPAWESPSGAWVVMGGHICGDMGGQMGGIAGNFSKNTKFFLEVC